MCIMTSIRSSRTALRRAAATLLVFVLLSCTATAAIVEGTGSLELAAHVVANGGGRSSGGSFTIQGTTGQIDADPLHPASAGPYAVTGGFWAAVVSPSIAADLIFTDGFDAAAR